MIFLSQRMGLPSSLALCFLVVSAGPATTQPYRGLIVGTISDRSGGAVAGAVVEVSGDRPGLTVITAADGLFRFVDLSPGSYGLTVLKPGFQPVKRAGLILGLGETLSLSLTLDIEGVQESVDVKTWRTGSGSRVSFTHDELARLPASPQAAVLVSTVPGAVTNRLDAGGSESHQQPQFVFRGSRMLDTAWTIDGVVVTDRQTGNLPGFFDVAALDEIQLAPASSDITRPGSGLGVMMVMRSGTSRMRATGRGYFSSDAFQASNLRDDLRNAPFFVTADTADHTEQIGEYAADIGGPLRRDRAWFAASSSRQDVRIFRQAGGPERAVLTPRHVKMNWRVTSRDMLNWLWLDNGIRRFGVNPGALRAPPTATQDQSSLYAANPFHGLWKIEAQRSVSSTLFLATRYAYYNTGVRNVSRGSGGAGVSQRLGETVGATSSSWSSRPQHSAAFDGRYFRNLGRTGHELKFGAGWQRVETFNETLWPGEGVVAFDISPTDRRARLYREQLGKTRLLFAGVYLSDTWSTDRATLDLGLRLDHQRSQALPSSPAGNPAFPHLLPGIDFKGETNVHTAMDLSPRGTITYALDAARRTVLRGGAGRYASQAVTGLAAQSNPANVSAWVEYPWQDRNGDRLAQPDEVRIDLPYLAFEGFRPEDPAAATPLIITDPDLASRITTDMSLALEREFTPYLRAIVGYSYSRHTRLPYSHWQGLAADDYEVLQVLSTRLPDGTQVSVPLYAPDPQRILENGSRRIIRSNDGHYSTYHGLEAFLVKGMSGGWMMTATAAWNNSRSFYDGQRPAVNSLGNPTRLDGASGGGPLSGPRDPLVLGGQLAPATSSNIGGGTVFLNAKWQASVKAAYLFPGGIDVAGILFARQGTPSPYVIPQRLGLDGVRTLLVSPTIDSVRLDDVWNLDIRLGKRIRFSRLTVQATGDIFNVLNGNAALVRERNLRSPNFDRVNMTVSPRILRLALRISY
ncbi:MAG: TonB-dependent receptor [Acidobacteria bacterium]|nr:TonB-dependent receptor [Acidobacteriota bacterium]